MTTRVDPPRTAGSSASASGAARGPHLRSDRFGADPAGPALRKAAILLLSLDQPLASLLLANLDRSEIEAVTLEIAKLEGVDPQEQHSVLEEFYGLGIKRLRFGFEDVVRMDDRDIREAYHEEDASTWALALAGASRAIRARILEALASGPSASLALRLDRLGPFRLDECEAAQLELAERLRRLHDQGQVTLPDPNGQEVLLV
ncbi:MAG: FliG C-terminal domain-containing protein [Isosphaeraceae bacterium]|nr:FliG C-terminal domain-containing protein [Isosphaeraceae bacterium]